MKRLWVIFINFFLMLGLFLLFNSVASCQQEVFRSDWPVSMTASSWQCTRDSVRTVCIQWGPPVQGISSYTVRWAKEDTIKFQDLTPVNTNSCVITNKFKLGEQYLLRVWYTGDQGRRVYGEWWELTCNLGIGPGIRVKPGFWVSWFALRDGFTNTLKDFLGVGVIILLIGVFGYGLLIKRGDRRDDIRTAELTLGLFGTVVGLIRVFYEVRGKAELPSPLPPEKLVGALSGGVYTAIITTIIGLFFMVLLLVLPQLRKPRPAVVSGCLIFWVVLVSFNKLYWWWAIAALGISVILWFLPKLSKLKVTVEK